MSGDNTSVRVRSALHRYAVVTAGATFLLLIAGGLVTSTDSGLAVPDWPLSYGQFFPPMVGGVLYEHGHRMMAAIVGMMILTLAVWLWKAEPRRWVRRLGMSALLAVVIQALLGGLTVRLLLPPPVSIAHACLGPIVFCLMASLAVCTAPSWIADPPRIEDRGMPSLRFVSYVVAGLAALQLVLGAVVRHTGLGLGWHIAGACGLIVAVGWWFRRLSRAPECRRYFRKPSRRLGGLLGVQFLLGFLSMRFREHVGLVTAHVATGSLLLAQAVRIAWEAHRVTRPMETVRRRRDYLELTKPRLTLLVLVTTAAGFWLGLTTRQEWWRILPVLLGTALVAGGANALNEWIERVPDGLMRRTQHRPLPAGRLDPEAARHFGFLLTVGGIVFLACAVNILAAALAALSAMSYLVLYTPSKRITPLCTLFGAVPGAIPPLIGWVGARQELSPQAWILFTILFVWQLPHFLSIAWMYREDYLRAGFRMLPVLDPDGASTGRQIAWSCAALLPISLLPTMAGLTGALYFFSALLAGLAFLGVSVWAAMARSIRSARRLFLSSVAYLAILCTLLVVDVARAHQTLPSYGAVPSFTLMDQEGRAVSQDDLRGNIWVADFIFTRCAGQCPMMSETMSRLALALQEKFPRLQLVSFTVDPAWDTPERLRAYRDQYQNRFHLPLNTPWLFVTGDQATIWQVCARGFQLAVGDGGPPAEPITHSVRLVLVDGSLRIRGYYDATDPKAMQQLQVDALRLLKEQGPSAS